MATGQSFIDEYLVKLGFDVNVDGIKKFFSEVDKSRNNILFNSKLINNTLVKTISSFTGLVASAAEAVYSFSKSSADFDKQMELEARSLWMTKDAYMALKEAVSALGYTIDDIGTIALDPELSSQFKQLYSMSTSFQNDYASMSQSFVTMRNFVFQFKKMRLEAGYFLQMLGAGLVKYFEGPLGQANSNLADIVSRIKNDLPGYVNKAVEIIGPAILRLIQLGNKGLNVVKRIYDFFKANPESLKNMLHIIATIYGILNPMAGFLMLFISTFKDQVDETTGETITLEERWEKVKNFIKEAKESCEKLWEFGKKIIDAIKSSDFQNSIQSLKDFVNRVLDLLDAFANKGFGAFLQELMFNKEWKFSSDANDSLLTFLGGLDNIEEILENIKVNSETNRLSLDKGVFSSEFLNLVKSSGYETMSDFMKTDYYRQMVDQVNDNRINNTHNAIQITNNYNGVDGSDARRMADEQVEQFNAAVMNMSFSY